MSNKVAIAVLTIVSLCSSFGYAGMVVGPEIDIQGIPDGSTTPAAGNNTDFQGVATGGGSNMRRYVIINLGTSDLNLTGTPRVSITGPNAADFVVTTQPAGVIAAGGGTEFWITFTPSAAGTRTATVTIANNDADENPYDFVVQGTGVNGSIQYCATQFPKDLTTTAATSNTIYGRVYAPGITTFPGSTGAVTGQLGYSFANVDPRTSPNRWVWVAAPYNAGYADSDPNLDEHQGNLVAPGAGSYSYAFRFSLNGGSTWTYCGRDGSLGDPAVMSAMTVTGTPNSPPALTTGTYAFTSIAEEDTANSGQLLSAFIASTPAGTFTDPNAGSPQGIAVTGVNNTGGSWQFSLDGGTTWTPFGSPTASAARLLAADASTRVRFVPNANFAGVTSLTFLSWDQTFGIRGIVLDTTGNGTGSSPFSANSATAQLTVTPVNDAPVNSVPGAQTTQKNIAKIFSAANGNAVTVNDVDDADDGTLGNQVLQVSMSSTNGTLTLGSTSGLTFVGGSNGSALMAFTGSISNINNGLNGLKFTPTSNYTGPAVITVNTDDGGRFGTGGTLNDTDTIDISVLAPTAANVTVSGRVANAAGFGIRGARVVFTDAQGNVVSAITNAFGYYTMTDAAAGTTYAVRAVAKGYTFRPRIITVNDSVSGLDLVSD